MKIRIIGFYFHFPQSLPVSLESARWMWKDSIHEVQALHNSIKSDSNFVADDLHVWTNCKSIECLDGSLVLENVLTNEVDSAVKLQIADGSDKSDIHSVLRGLLWKGALDPDDLDERMTTVLSISGFCPLLDRPTSLDLLQRHRRYLASFTYGENLAAGLTPDFVSREFFELDKKPDGDLHSFVFKNFHELDAEIAFYQPDLRIFRLELNGLTARSAEILKSLKARVKDSVSLQWLSDTIQSQPSVLRPWPSYIEMELSSASPVQDRLLPEAGNQQLPKPERETILQSIASMPPQEITVCLGGLGDSGADEESVSVALSLLEMDSVKEVFVETYGYDLVRWIQEADRHGQAPWNKLSFIVRLCSLRSDRYDYFYAGGNLNQVLQQLEQVQSWLKNLEADRSNKTPSFFVEMQKIREVEDEIHDFFQKFDPTPITPILRKQNTYCGQLENRSIADLTPLIRGFCWHLARDLYINAEGKVPLCRQDPHASRISASVQDETLLSIFQAGDREYVHSMKGQHDQIQAPCLQCDEWYLFQG